MANIYHSDQSLDVERSVWWSSKSGNEEDRKKEWDRIFFLYIDVCIINVGKITECYYEKERKKRTGRRRRKKCVSV